MKKYEKWIIEYERSYKNKVIDKKIGTYLIEIALLERHLELGDEN